MTELTGPERTEFTFEVTHWADVDKIVRWTSREYRARVLSSSEGPDSRTIVLKFDAGCLTLYQWDTGDVTLVPANEKLRVVAAAIKENMPNILSKSGWRWIWPRGL